MLLASNRFSQLQTTIPLALTAAVVLLAATTAHAITVEMSSSTAPVGGTGSFDVFCTGTAGDTADFYSFDIQLAAPPGITFTAADVDTADPYIFGSVQDPPLIQSLTGNSLEVADSDSPSFQTVSGSDAFGLAHITYSVSLAATPATYIVSSPSSSIVAVAPSIGLDLFGTITVTVPEPATFALLAIAATNLLTRRRRRG